MVLEYFQGLVIGFIVWWRGWEGRGRLAGEMGRMNTSSHNKGSASWLLGPTSQHWCGGMSFPAHALWGSCGLFHTIEMRLHWYTLIPWSSELPLGPPFGFALRWQCSDCSINVFFAALQSQCALSTYPFLYLTPSKHWTSVISVMFFLPEFHIIIGSWSHIGFFHSTKCL